MKVNPEQIKVVHNEERKQFEVKIDKYLAVSQYILTKDRIIFTHTEVPLALEGNGIGSKLARTALDYARSNQINVMPLCPYMAGYMRKHPEYQDLLVKGVKI